MSGSFSNLLWSHFLLMILHTPTEMMRRVPQGELKLYICICITTLLLTF